MTKAYMSWVKLRPSVKTYSSLVTKKTYLLYNSTENKVATRIPPANFVRSHEVQVIDK